MCPAGIAIAAMTAAGATSEGRVPTFAKKELRPKAGAKIVEPITQIGTDC